MNLTLSQWNRDINVLGELRTSWNDRLKVCNETLQLEKGSGLREAGTPVASDANAVSNYLFNLTIIGKNCFKHIQENFDHFSDFYERISFFNKQCKCLSVRISDLQFTYRRHDINDTRFAKHLSMIQDQAYLLSLDVKKYKSTLIKPPLRERSPKHIDYNERTHLSEIKLKYPKRVPLEDTVAAAKKALFLAGSSDQDSLYLAFLKKTYSCVQTHQRDPIYLKCMNVAIQGLLLTPPMFLTILKTIIWNPIEYLFQGEVRSRSPLFLTFESLCNHRHHMQAYQRYATQLLHCPFITEQVAEAFERLAPHAESLDLEKATLGSNNIRELEPFLTDNKKPNAITVNQFINGLEQIYIQKKLETPVSLYTLHSRYEWFYRLNLDTKNKKIDLIFSQVASIPDPIKPNPFYPVITPNALKRLLEAAVSSPACREIKISRFLSELTFVEDILRESPYKLRGQNGNKKIYYRKSTPSNLMF